MIRTGKATTQFDPVKLPLARVVRQEERQHIRGNSEIGNVGVLLGIEPVDVDVGQLAAIERARSLRAQIRRHIPLHFGLHHRLKQHVIVAVVLAQVTPEAAALECIGVLRVPEVHARIHPGRLAEDRRFVAGLFLLVFSDTELWPFGPQSWWYGLTHNLEDLQHKTFAAILLTLGVLEIQRARGALKAAWAGLVFPTLALCGSVLLLFHEHHSRIHGADHMTVMARIQAEHLNFAIAGCGVGVVKGLSELHTRWQTVFLKSWPVLLIVLGVLLLRYVE